MGGHMATNLAKGGCTVLVYDKQPGRMDQLKNATDATVSSRLIARSSVEEMMEDSELNTLVTMLPSSPQVLEVIIYFVDIK